jgi:hypothetical protein
VTAAVSPNAYLSLAGFEVTIIGRFWVTAEATNPVFTP